MGRWFGIRSRTPDLIKKSVRPGYVFSPVCSEDADSDVVDHTAG